MCFPEQARVRPTLKRTAQRRTARLAGCRPQAAPRRAFAQEPAQGGQHPHSFRHGVSGRWLTWFLTALDHRRDQVQNPGVQSRPHLCKISANPRDGHRHGQVEARLIQLKVVVETASEKSSRHLLDPAETRFRFVENRREVFPARAVCSVLRVSASGCHAWRGRPESARARASKALVEDIRRVHVGSRRCCGSPRAHASLRARGNLEGLPPGQAGRVQPGGAAHARSWHPGA